MTRRLTWLFLMATAAAGLARAGYGPGLPLPPAPVRVVIPDAAAFDKALTGPFRAALTGESDENDPVVKAWRWSPVGAKLEEQWGIFSGDLAWTWSDLMALQPRSIGLSLLGVGNLEAVLIVETPLADLPAEPPEGVEKSYKGISYRVVARGAGDGSLDVSRRMGLAWAREQGMLFLATSERALLLALDEVVAKNGVAPPLPGIIDVELDMKALKKDRYFRREFLFDPDVPDDRIVAALAIEGGTLVETREGGAAETPAARRLDASTSKAAAASGWEVGTGGLLEALRSGILEPVPRLGEKPLLGIGDLPAAEKPKEQDTYLVNIEKPVASERGNTWEEGELAKWKALIDAVKPSGWGWTVGRDGARSIVVAIPAEREADVEELCRATVERRAGKARLVAARGTKLVQVGPDLTAVALKRSGDFLWMSTAPEAIASATAPAPEADLVRWGDLDLASVRSEEPRWQRAEGAAGGDAVRPFSDRLSGILDWMPQTGRITVERRKTEKGWRERVVFGLASQVVSSDRGGGQTPAHP